MMPKVAIVGSPEYMNARKIQDMVWKLKQKFGDELTIIGDGDKNGVGKFAKKYAIELGCQYKEYGPAHEPFNLYSGMPKSYYTKNFHPTCFVHRNMLIAQNSDYAIAFVEKTAKKSNGTKQVIKEFKKLKKPIVIMD